MNEGPYMQSEWPSSVWGGTAEILAVLALQDTKQSKCCSVLINACLPGTGEWVDLCAGRGRSQCQALLRLRYQVCKESCLLWLKELVRLGTVDNALRHFGRSLLFRDSHLPGSV